MPFCPIQCQRDTRIDPFPVVASGKPEVGGFLFIEEEEKELSASLKGASTLTGFHDFLNQV